MVVRDLCRALYRQDGHEVLVATAGIGHVGEDPVRVGRDVSSVLQGGGGGNAWAHVDEHHVRRLAADAIGRRREKLGRRDGPGTGGRMKCPVYPDGREGCGTHNSQGCVLTLIARFDRVSDPLVQGGKRRRADHHLVRAKYLVA